MMVLLDTNVLVAAYATRGLCADVVRVVLTRHDLVIGEVILDEFETVALKKLRLSLDDWLEVRSTFERYELVPRPSEHAALGLSDPDDEWIYATAVAGNADVIVTGDKVFMEDGSRSAIPIVNPRQFWEMLKNSSEG